MTVPGPVPLVTAAAAALAAALACAAPAAGAPVVPPAERYGPAAVDLSTNGRALVAWEEPVPGPDRIRVAIRRADRLDRPTPGRVVARGDIELVRVADAPGGPHLVVWRRGARLRVSVLSRGRWRTELLPAGVRTERALTAAIAGSRIILVAGDGAGATAVVRVGPRRWTSHPLPPSPPRSALMVGASEPSGRVVAAWTETGFAGRSVAASAFDPGTRTWSPPATLVAPGAVPGALPGDLALNGRGDAILAIAAAGQFAPATAAVPVRHLPAVGGAWRALPDAPGPTAAGAQQVGVTPGGVPVRAWAAGGDVVFSAAVSGAWTAPEVAWARAPRLLGPDDLAVAAGGRVVLAAATDGGRRPDRHVLLARPAAGGAWSAPLTVAITDGPFALIAGGRRVVAVWAAPGGRPEAAPAP